MSALPSDWSVIDGGRSIDGRLPAHDLDAEAAVLAAVIVDQPSRVSQVSALLPEHFYSESHRQIFDAVLHLHRAGEPIDVVQVAGVLKARDRLEQVGGMAYITEMLNGSPAFAHVGAHAKIVYERWRTRQLAQIADRIAAASRLGVEDVQQFADDAVREISTVAQSGWTRSRETNAQACKRIFSSIVDAQAKLAEGGGARLGLPTGLSGLDALTSGLHAGKKLTIGALTKVGKTTLAIQIALHVAKLGIGGDFFCSEMSKDEMWAIAMSHLARVNSQHVALSMAGMRALSAAEWQAMMGPASWMHASPLEFECREDGWSADTVEAAVAESIERRRTHRQPPLGFIVVDYLQVMLPSRGYEKREEHHVIAENARRLKVIAEKYRIAVIELAQQLREPEKGTGLNAKPGVYSFAGCKKISNHTNVLVFLIRNPRYNKAGKVVGEDKRRLTLMLAAQRGGQSMGDGDAGEIQLEFEPEFGHFACVDAGSREWVG